MLKKTNNRQQIPNFKYPIVKELYAHDLSIDRQILKDIIDLGKKVIPDLETVLKDIIKHDEEYSQQKDFNWCTPTHALRLLGELHAEQSLARILEIFKQDEDFLEFWFNDSLNEETWEVIYKCGHNSLDIIEEFLKDQSIWVYSRTAVSEGLKQIALHDQTKRKEIIGLYKRVINATKAHAKPKEKGYKKDASEAIGYYVSDLIDFNEPKLQTFLLKLFKEGVVETAIVGPESIGENYLPLAIKEIESIYDLYDGLEQDSRFEELTSPILKVGRNEPCPCGSGKKYKKCHYLKQ